MFEQHKKEAYNTAVHSIASGPGVFVNPNYKPMPRPLLEQEEDEKEQEPESEEEDQAPIDIENYTLEDEMKYQEMQE